MTDQNGEVEGSSDFNEEDTPLETALAIAAAVLGACAAAIRMAFFD